MWSPHAIIPHISSLPQTQKGSKKDSDHLPSEFTVLGMEGDGVWILVSFREHGFVQTLMLGSCSLILASYLTLPSHH